MNAILSTTARMDLAVQPQKLYSETISAIKNGNWTKLKKAINLGMPLYSEVDQTLNSHYILRIKRAIEEEDMEDTFDYFVRLVSGGIKVLINASLGSASSTRKDAIRQAFSEYLTLNPIFTEIDRDSASLAIQVFKNALSLTNNSPKYKATVKHLNTTLDDLVSKV